MDPQYYIRLIYAKNISIVYLKSKGNWATVFIYKIWQPSSRVTERTLRVINKFGSLPSQFRCWLSAFRLLSQNTSDRVSYKQ